MTQQLDSNLQPPGSPRSGLSGRTVLVTGAKGGLGTTVTRTLLESGATVIGAARSIRPEDFPSPRFHAIAADLSSLAGAKQLVEEALAIPRDSSTIQGEPRSIDALVHLVGAYGGGDPIASTDDETWRRMMSVNLDSAFHAARAVLPAMRSSGRGRIVAIGSRAAMEPSANYGAYAISKAALVALVRQIAVENRDLGITANVILPGTMDTPANREAMPAADTSKWVPAENAASLVCWLVSDEGASMTGAVLPLFGGE